MIKKIIIAEVTHNKKGYLFREISLSSDKIKSSLIIPDEYVEQDMENNICCVYTIFENMVKANVYSSVKSIERAIKNEVLKAELHIFYINDINKAALNPYVAEDLAVSLHDLDVYCSGIQYTYSMKDKSITRYELYGDLLLGNVKERQLSELIKLEELRYGKEIKVE